MRINKYIAAASGLSRRAADLAIEQGKVRINGTKPLTGQNVQDSDVVTLDDRTLTAPASHTTVILNKPSGYVVSREGQGSRTIYDLLPPDLHHLKPVGRLDKDSSGLLLLTTDGQLAQELTHPKYQKEKIYEVTLNKPLTPAATARLRQGVSLEDGVSHLTVTPLKKPHDTPTSQTIYEVRMHEGRNRQIRRTFDAIGHKVTQLHRINFGPYGLARLRSGGWTHVPHQ